ncbi:MAG TPA: beta-aspartyl-peptidase [Xanthomonadales bacterium]|nr:beta-aspartyl-peptidase [Xanthomonadales bacterium]
MLILIKNAEIYTPDYFGRGCVLVAGGKVVYLGSAEPEPSPLLDCEVVDLEGAALVPGFIDGHVHITGGGGEDGFATQAPSVPLSQFTRHGVTSVVGLLGTDDVTRSTSNVLARVYALRAEGLSAWCWTGGYHVPPTTFSGSVSRDVVNIEAIIGLGELAISDHRSSQPTYDELLRLASEVHVAGLLTRKAGVLHLHLGDGQRGLELVRRALAESELPPRVFHPTHVNRNKALFDEACELARQGVTIDVTAFPVDPLEDAWSAADAWERYHQGGGPAAQFTISSDGGGCLPTFNAQGELVRMEFASSAGLPETLQDLHQRGHALQDTLPAMTRNVARLLRLRSKGQIAVGLDADLVVLDGACQVRDVLALGQWMVRAGEVVHFGTFEQASSA